MSELENTGSNPTPTNDRVESRRILDKMSVGNRFRLMFRHPLLPEEWIERNDWQGSRLSAKTAIEDARTLHMLPKL